MFGTPSTANTLLCLLVLCRILTKDNLGKDAKIVPVHVEMYDASTARLKDSRKYLKFKPSNTYQPALSDKQIKNKSCP
jgi:hypothetical protein